MNLIPMLLSLEKVEEFKHLELKELLLLNYLSNLYTFQLKTANSKITIEEKVYVPILLSTVLKNIPRIVKTKSNAVRLLCKLKKEKVIESEQYKQKLYLYVPPQIGQIFTNSGEKNTQTVHKTERSTVHKTEQVVHKTEQVVHKTERLDEKKCQISEQKQDVPAIPKNVSIVFSNVFNKKNTLPFPGERPKEKKMNLKVEDVTESVTAEHQKKIKQKGKSRNEEFKKFLADHIYVMKESGYVPQYSLTKREQGLVWGLLSALEARQIDRTWYLREVITGWNRLRDLLQFKPGKSRLQEYPTIFEICVAREDILNALLKGTSNAKSAIVVYTTEGEVPEGIPNRGQLIDEIRSCGRVAVAV